MVYDKDERVLAMSHLLSNKDRLIARVARIRGQVQAIEKALHQNRECPAMLQMIAACQGAMAGLMVEVVEGYIRLHVLDPRHKPNEAQVAAAEELIDVLRSYLR